MSVVTIEQRLLADDPTLEKLVLANRSEPVPESLLKALARNTTVQAAHFELSTWSDQECATLERSGAPSASLASLYLTHNKITVRNLGSIIKASGAPRSFPAESLACR